MVRVEVGFGRYGVNEVCSTYNRRLTASTTCAPTASETHVSGFLWPSNQSLHPPTRWHVFHSKTTIHYETLASYIRWSSVMSGWSFLNEYSWTLDSASGWWHRWLLTVGVPSPDYLSSWNEQMQPIKGIKKQNKKKLQSDHLSLSPSQAFHYHSLNFSYLPFQWFVIKQTKLWKKSLGNETYLHGDKVVWRNCIRPMEILQFWW